MDRIERRVFLAAITALVALEGISILIYRRPLAREITPLAWTAGVRVFDLLLFFILFGMFSVPLSRAGLQKFAPGAVVGIAASAVLGGGFFLVLYLIRTFWGVDLRVIVNPGVRVHSFAPLAVLCILGPFAEEIFFRGLWYSLIREKTGLWAAVLLSACLFAAGHIFNTEAAQLFHGHSLEFLIRTFSVLLVPFVGGIALALLYEFSKSLLAPFILHGVANFFLYSGMF